jgi:hypothetical protein
MPMESLLLLTAIFALGMLIAGLCGLAQAMWNIRGRVRGRWRL